MSQSVEPEFPPTPRHREDDISQVPALQLLQNLGYTYLTPDEALALRGGKFSGVLLDGILEEQLRSLNSVRYKGETYEFSEGNIQSAILALKDVMFDGLVRTNEKIYDLLLLGKSLPQVIHGDTKSFQLHYIDWEHPEKNVFHVTEEFAVERSGSHETRRPDIVLFVNGIPLGVIECKRSDSDDPLGEAISQQIRNQKDDQIPRLFLYAQLLLAVTKNEAKYATVGTNVKFWAVWKEEVDEQALRTLVNRPLSPERKTRLFQERPREVRAYFDAQEAAGGREVTEQDRTLYALCRPERLLELTQRFIVFDAGEKKIARYQQYFCVQKILDRIRRRDARGQRLGGVVWHTQGSGKSLTMVMLAKALALEELSASYKIVLVTDRIDLDDQIWKTFKHTGMEPTQARTGRHLAKLLQDPKAGIITTVIDKFVAAVGRAGVRAENPDIFVLVDEGHRGQYGPLHARMRRALPNACFIGFTGTPVMKKERNTVERFGGLIDTYTIDQAVADKAVVPLLYEGRHVDQKVDRESVDAWFDRITGTLSPEQATDLKRKFSTTSQLNKTQQKVMRIAWDVSEHFRDNWQGTGFKAQLVAQDKATALLYKRFLDEFGMVSSEVLISAPDDREGDDDVLEENKKEVVTFWRAMMTKYGSEIEYNRQLINAFKHGETPEIIIVVDKLLTGFDAPRNTVLYLTRMLKDHTLLQAIARVNRIHEGKEFGYIIDYRGVIAELDSALDLYQSLTAFDREDLGVTVTDVAAEIAKLPQRHSDLWDVFKSIPNKRDVEAYERHLADEAIRALFYERLSAYARTLAIALSTVKFLEETPEAKVEKYRADLRFFMTLRSSVRRRYAEVVDFREYEAKIQKLLDMHVGTGEVEQITELVNIFDKDAFAQEVEKLATPASKADTIAYRTKKTITERMPEDPVFYKKFSRLLEETIEAFRAQRLSDAEYLRRVREISHSIRDRTGDSVPEPLRYNSHAKALYGVVRETLSSHTPAGFDAERLGADVALKIDQIIDERKIVNWTQNLDVQNQMKTDIEDHLYEIKDRYGIPLTFEDIDRILDQCLDIARVRKTS